MALSGWADALVFDNARRGRRVVTAPVAVSMSHIGVTTCPYIAEPPLVVSAFVCIGEDTYTIVGHKSVVFNHPCPSKGGESFPSFGGAGGSSQTTGLCPFTVYLFRKNLKLPKFYKIGQWWVYPDGTPRTVASLKKEMLQFVIVRQRLRKSEKFIPVKPRSAEWEWPTNKAKLKATLDKEDDMTLYDWFSIMLRKPTVFQTIPPRWLLDRIQSQPLKCHDFLNALYERLRNTTNKDIILAFQIYHKHVLK